MPTRSEPTKPGPSVTAMAAKPSKPVCACSSARRTTGTMARKCSREASSGTTPPYFEWVASCDATTDDRTFFPSSTTAAAVSSQHVLIPRMATAIGKFGSPPIRLSPARFVDRARTAGGPRSLTHAGAVPNEQCWEDWMFREFPQFLGAGDCLVLNDSKVVPSRLYGH